MSWSAFSRLRCRRVATLASAAAIAGVALLAILNSLLPPRGLDELLSVLENDPALTSRANVVMQLEALATGGDHRIAFRIAQALCKSLRRSDPSIQLQVVTSLERILKAQPSLVPLLYEDLTTLCYRDADPMIRVRISSALTSNLRDRALFSHFERMLADQSDEVIWEVLAQISERGHGTMPPDTTRNVAKRLREIVTDEKREDTFRLMAIDSLLTVLPNSDEPMQLLESIINKSNVRTAALMLGRYGGRARGSVSILIGFFDNADSSTKANISQALGEVGIKSPAVRTCLLRAITNDETTVCVYALQAIEQLGFNDQETVVAVLHKLDDEECRPYVQQVLRRIAASNEGRLAIDAVLAMTSDRMAKQVLTQVLRKSPSLPGHEIGHD